MEKQSTFSVNKEFTNDELFELKEIIIDFIKKKAESSIVCYYRPEEKANKAGFVVGKECVVGEPDSQKFNELLDLVKKVQPNEDGKRAEVMIVIPLPI